MLVSASMISIMLNVVECAPSFIALETAHIDVFHCLMRELRMGVIVCVCVGIDDIETLAS